MTPGARLRGASSAVLLMFSDELFLAWVIAFGWSFMGLCWAKVCAGRVRKEKESKISKKICSPRREPYLLLLLGAVIRTILNKLEHYLIETVWYFTTGCVSSL
jgi:hypothetical protein